MNRFHRMLTIALIIVTLLGVQPANAVLDINTPAETPNEVIFFTADIQTDGDANMGGDCRVKIRKGSETGTLHDDSGPIDVPPESASWSHRFDAPSAHWATGTDFFCVLYNSVGGIADYHDFTITDQL